MTIRPPFVQAAGRAALLPACIALLACTAAAANAASPAPSRTAGDRQAYRIFERAQQTWEAQRYPSVVSYVVDVRTAMGPKAQQRHYHCFWNAQTGTVEVNPVSDEQLADPYRPPPGFDVGFPGWHAHVGGPNEGTGTRDDAAGIPVLAPNYSFGIAPYLAPSSMTPAQLVAQIRQEYHDPSESKVNALERESGLRTIASVVAASPSYAIALSGTEIIDGHEDYHLRLQPMRDPRKYRLRDLWIDELTYATDKLRSQGNFVDGATSNVAWTVSFQDVGGAHYIQSETSESPMPHWYDSVTVSFERIAEGTPPRFGDFNTIDTGIREP